MAMITYHGDAHRHLPTLLSRWVETTARLRRNWERRRTAKMLEGLPTEIRKDIGWPDSRGFGRE